MGRLDIIIGDQGVGKTTFAKILVKGKEHIYVEMSGFLKSIASPPNAENAEVFILDEGTYPNLKSLFWFWKAPFYEVHKRGESPYERNTPDIIAVFQTANISHEWIEIFENQGANIYCIERKPFHISKAPNWIIRFIDWITGSNKRNQAASTQSAMGIDELQNKIIYITKAGKEVSNG